MKRMLLERVRKLEAAAGAGAAVGLFHAEVGLEEAFAGGCCDVYLGEEGGFGAYRLAPRAPEGPEDLGTVYDASGGVAGRVEGVDGSLLRWRDEREG